MAKHALKVVYFHEGTSFHMQGKNFGNKIQTALGARMMYDDETKEIHVYYNGLVSTLSSVSAKNWDYAQTPASLLEYFEPRTEAAEEGGHPLVRRRGRPRLEQATQVETLAYDDNDMSPEAHRARVRAASANSNRPAPRVQNDQLFQEARLQALGMKTQAQVDNPTMPKQGVSVAPKPKAISHAQLTKQVAAEAKE